MSGHSHWAGIKHKKEITDKKRGQLFSKLLNAVAVAARQEPNPQFNPRLRTAIEKAKENSVPTEKIDGAIKRASESKNLEELTVEAYGPAGVAIIIEAITDNKNRTMQEIKSILNENSGKIAEPGSVRWAFDPPTPAKMEWTAKFTQEIDADDKNKIDKLLAELEDQDDVQKVYTNVKL